MRLDGRRIWNYKYARVGFVISEWRRAVFEAQSMCRTHFTNALGWFSDVCCAIIRDNGEISSKSHRKCSFIISTI